MDSSQDTDELPEIEHSVQIFGPWVFTGAFTSYIIVYEEIFEHDACKISCLSSKLDIISNRNYCRSNYSLWPLSLTHDSKQWDGESWLRVQILLALCFKHLHFAKCCCYCVWACILLHAKPGESKSWLGGWLKLRKIETWKFNHSLVISQKNPFHW